MRIHGFKGALGSIRVFAQQAVKIIENSQQKLRSGRDSSVVAGCGKAGVCLLDQGIAILHQHYPTRTAGAN
jgi:hypothetical protein